VPARHGHVEGRFAVEEAGRLSMNGGLRVSMSGYTWARVRDSARRRAAELMRAESSVPSAVSW
jgi:hypothetical protein